MVKHKTKKGKSFTDEAGGKGTIKRPVVPSASLKSKKRKGTDKQTTAETALRQSRDLDNKKKNKSKKKMTQAQDDRYDRAHGIKEGSPADIKQDRLNGVSDKKKSKAKVVKHSVIAHKSKKKAIKTSGTFNGKSNRLGQGGRAAQLRAQGVPGGVIGNLARAAHAAPGQANYHKKKESKNKAKVERATKGARYNGRAY